MVRLKFVSHNKNINNQTKMHQTEFLNTVLPLKDKVFRLAKRLLVSIDEAEDATQELFLKIMEE